MGPRTTAPLSSRRTFAALGARGQRGTTDLIRVRFLPSNDEGPREIAYAIPRRIGGAVVRNRIRRRCRAAVDALAGELLPGAYLISPAGSCRAVPFEALLGSLRSSLASAGALGKDER
jgi:ribonuclease P protein component